MRVAEIVRILKKSPKKAQQVQEALKAVKSAPKKVAEPVKAEKETSGK